MADEPRPSAPARRCPVCGKAVAAGTPAPPRPFCSERCRQVDLGRWLSEGYAIPGGPPGESEERDQG